ncbi:hypothetical protein [Kitasatospora purpeofusca]|uniref:hypothetical protein n=1 Tax=Kitasatospora purpeofusca TaxID=67352 RepID=UPI00381F55A9
MGRDKARKPRKPAGDGAVPRFIDLPSVSLDTKKDVVLSNIMRDEMWPQLRAMLTARHGEFTVAEEDLLDLPEPIQAEALAALHFYAVAQLPAQAQLGLREAMVRTSENCRQALDRLL